MNNVCIGGFMFGLLIFCSVGIKNFNVVNWWCILGEIKVGWRWFCCIGWIGSSLGVVWGEL